MDISEFVERFWPGLLFAFGCFVITWVIRRVVQGIVPKMKVNYYWNEVALPTLPVVIGGSVALVFVQYPYPMENPAWYARLLLGIVAGFTSSWAVKIVKAFIKHRTGVDVDEDEATADSK